MDQDVRGVVTPVQCRRCVFSSNAFPGLELDAGGVCQFCLQYDRLISDRVRVGREGEALLKHRIEEIKERGRKGDYDCVIGVSGGTDSTYVAYLVKQWGLRPLAVHFDNGWDSELAVANISECLGRLGIDLETHVVDWRQFRDLQVSFLRASTPDGEVPSDHAIQALLWRTAASIGVQTVISGLNFTTESPAWPEWWAYGHSDWRYIRDVHRRYGQEPLTTFPHYSLEYLVYLNAVKRIRSLSILNYLDYDRQAAQYLLKEKLAWRDYGGKHHESLYTRFYQGYILPKKFGIDKRYGHLSDLVRAGLVTREEASEELTKPPYDPELQEQDRRYVMKKLGLSEGDFAAIMEAPIRTFRDFRNNYARVQLMKRAVNRLRAGGRYDL